MPADVQGHFHGHREVGECGGVVSTRPLTAAAAVAVLRGDGAAMPSEREIFF